jgi:purine-binding chemotaxis protein CheW
MKNFVIFSVSNQVMAIPAENVERIMNHTNVIKIPGTQAYLEGAFNYNNEIIPVINLKKLLMLGTDDLSSDRSQIIVIQSNESKVAILVDDINDIQSTSENSISLKINNKHILGLIDLNNEIVNVINPEIVTLAKVG